MPDAADLFARPAPTMVTAAQALPGRPSPVLPRPTTNIALGTPLAGPWPDGTRQVYLAAGCFWGVEKLWWQTPGVVGTAVGYMGGFTPNPTYEEVCTGRTGHAETVHVVYDPAVLTDEELFRRFWEMHDPTQGYRQGADVGTQYRSAIFWTTSAQQAAAERTGDVFAARLRAAGYGAITTAMAPADVPAPRGAGPFYLAEDYHQQYLLKNPDGYCPVHATGVACR